MKDLPYHHLPDGSFRNPEGSPKRDPNFKWDMSKWNKEKKKIKINIPEGHVINKKEVLENLEKFKNDDYVAWIGHATFLIKLGDTTIITDPVFSKNMGPWIFGPKRYVDPAVDLNEIPEVNLFLLTHNHYDHLDYKTIKKFPYKKANVLAPLKLGRYFSKNKFKNVKEMDWYDQTIINDLKIIFVPAVHWSKRTLTDTNKTLWGSFLIEYKDKKIFFACDTGYGNIYKELGKKYGPIDLTFINIGAYNFYPMSPKKDKSIYHTNPEEALNIGKDLNSKKVLGMHWGTAILSLEDPFEPPVRFKNATNMYGYHKDDAIIFKIGEVQKLEDLL
jgi:L-ascorbate metabolism protein UlaG (beta-lactamase superfamily)